VETRRNLFCISSFPNEIFIKKVIKSTTKALLKNVTVAKGNEKVANFQLLFFHQFGHCAVL
jgi:hypothetical protein